MNILDAFYNISTYESYDFKEVHKDVLNRIQAVGSSLEKFVKCAFISDYDSLEDMTGEELDSKLEDIFEWQGSANNPPDAILKNSDAFEIKKLGGASTSIPLNSSYPKDYVYPDDDKLSNKCLDTIDDFAKKDFAYIVGQVSKSNQLKSLWIVYGDCIAADKSVYEKAFNDIRVKTQEVIEENEYSSIQTKEPGRFRGIDEEDRTVMRVRGMFELDHPQKTFSTYLDYDQECEFRMHMVCTKKKFDSFSDSSKKRIQGGKIEIKDISIPDPNKKGELLEAKLITFTK